MKKIVVNLSMFNDKPTGLGVYTKKCAAILSKNFDTSIIGSNKYITYGKLRVKTPDLLEIGRGTILALFRQVFFLTIKLNSDELLYTPTHHGLLRVKNQIITIHDLICLRYPNQHILQYLYFKYFIPILLKRCISVFTVSNATKIDINKYYNYPLNKIFIVSNSVDLDEFKNFSDKRQEIFINEQKPYLLVVGARYPHKNIEELIYFNNLWKKKYRLVICSASGKYLSKLEYLIQKYDLSSSISFFNYVEFDKLRYLYSNASALVYPSLWEGFGIPPLEAIASGIPVIASDIPPLREVLDGSAIFIKFCDENSWTSAFSAIENKTTVSNLKQNYTKTLSKYSTKNQKDELLFAINSLMK